MTDPLLSVRGLQAWYGESHVLHGVDFDVFQGETVAILGRNGVGKTTTLKAIMGVLRQRTGQVSLKGVDLMSVPLHHVARHGLGFVPEDRGIFASLTVRENLMLPPGQGRDGFSLKEIYDLFPNLMERGDTQGTKLSGGEQQMLAIARILRTGPLVLMLDEPTEGLAPVIVQRIGEITRVLKERGMTVILVEQNFRFARKYSDRFLVMEDGRVIDGFPASELAAREAALHDVLGV
jgi:branched-chain amino acid transport system ATP-binding protein